MSDKVRTDLKNFNNSWYNPGNPIARLIWYVVNSILFNSYLFPFSGFKVGILKIFGSKIGSGVIIKPKVNIKYPWMLQIGNDSWIGENVWIDNLAKVKIGNNVCLSQGVMLLCGNHDYSKSTFDLIVAEINIEDGVWIGAKSLVGPHVTCHNHAVLAAFSFASKNLEPYAIYSGNPAIKIKERIMQ